MEGGRGPASARLPRGPLIRHHGSPTGERAPWVGGHRPASTPQTRLPTPSAPRKSQALNLDESGPRPWPPRCPTEGERKMETSPGLRSDPVRCLSSSVLTGQAAGAGTGGARSSGGAGSSGAAQAARVAPCPGHGPHAAGPCKPHGILSQPAGSRRPHLARGLSGSHPTHGASPS